MAHAGTADVPFLDMQSEAFRADIRGAYRAAQAAGPAVRTERGLEILWYDLARELLSDSRLDTDYTKHDSGEQFENLRAFAANGFLVALNGAQHDRIRRVLRRTFAMRSVEVLRPMMREVAHTLIDEFAPDGAADLMWQFSHRFSVQVLCRTIGVATADIPLFDRATIEVRHQIMEPGRADDALGKLHDYVVDMLATRSGAARDDLVSAMIEAQETEGHLTEDEVAWNIVNLLFAGHDTTRLQLTSIARTLLDQEGAWALLGENPRVVPGAVAESIRLCPTVPTLRRKANQDFEHAGIALAAGEPVVVNMFAASRDPRAFPDPDRFDIERRSGFDPFGHGFHYCLGASLAMAEMAEGAAALTARLHDVRTQDADLGILPMMGPALLPVTFRPR